MICQVGFGGRDPQSGEYYSYYETAGGGYGGRSRTDGPDAVQTHFQNTQNAPIEEIESNYPVRITRYGLIPDSEGPGRFRGGLGLCREYVFVGHEPSYTILADRVRFPGVGALRRPFRENGSIRFDQRKRRNGPPVQGDGAARGGTIGSTGVLRRRGIRISL